MSLPHPSRTDDTVVTDPKALVCPRCRTTWQETEAPNVCPHDGSSLVRQRELAAAAHDPMLGKTLEGRYTITARLGSGSMGTVYRAKQHAMGREVAIKILRGDRAVDDNAKARFLREARANSLLASPNTVTVFDFGQSESGELYLAMELLEGESLGQRLSRIGRLPVPVAVDAARQALRSLSEAHAKGIIHRDLKPDNLFFARVLTSSASASSPSDGHEEIVKVLDFGIAKMLPNGEAAPLAQLDAVETQVGTVFGTPRYMSPEQAQGKPLDPRTDLYSLGVIIYQMLTGRPPFTDTDAVVVMARHIKSVPKRPNEAVPEANVPRELEDVVMRSLSKVPEERQASADVFAGELLAALEASSSTTSGVRASITNAAGIRVPDSLRPPPVSLPPPPASMRRGISSGTIATICVLVIALAAVAVYFVMMRQRQVTPATPPPAPSASAAIASAAPTPPPRAAVSASEPMPPPPPTATASVTAAPSTTPPPKPPHGRRMRPPPTTATTSAQTSPSPPPHPTATSSYGVFE